MGISSGRTGNHSNNSISDWATIQNNVAAELFKANAKGKRLKEHAQNSGVLKAQKKCTYCNPSKGLLWFLCEKLINDYADKLQSIFISTAQKYKPAYEDWSKDTNAGRKGNALAPFEDTRKSLLDGRLILRNYHRLLIEGFMLLEPQSRVIGIMSNKHPLMKSSTWKKHLREVMLTNPYEPLKLKSSFYFAFDLNVLRNIYRDNISNGIFTKKDLLHNCTMRGGHGLTMKVLNGHQQLVTFHVFMTNHNSFMIFSQNLDSRIPQMKKVLSNV